MRISPNASRVAHLHRLKTKGARVKVWENIVGASKADYGIDAPGVVRNLAIGGAVGTIIGITLYRVLRRRYAIIARIFLGWSALSGLPNLFAAGYMIWSSKVGKLLEAERVMDILTLCGDEKVLDVGCGRGLMMIQAARRLNSGKVVGVDIWRSEDQSGNYPEAAWENALAEGVTDGIEITDGDARDLPFENNTFDVVISSLVLHNIDDKEERDRAVREISRVLKPGGQLALVDFQYTNEYAHILGEIGIEDITLSKLHFLLYPPVRVVTGRKTAI